MFLFRLVLFVEKKYLLMKMIIEFSNKYIGNIIENINNKYRISENEPLISIFEEKIEKFYIRSITERVKEYFRALSAKV